MIRLFRASNFRCLERAELNFGPRFNLIHGANASGKTSLLEALSYLGRGKSFRGASTANLIRHGGSEFVLFGEVERRGAVRWHHPGGSLSAQIHESAGPRVLDARCDPGLAGGLPVVASVYEHRVLVRVALCDRYCGRLRHNAVLFDGTGDYANHREVQVGFAVWQQKQKGYCAQKRV